MLTSNILLPPPPHLAPPRPAPGWHGRHLEPHHRRVLAQVPARVGSQPRLEGGEGGAGRVAPCTPSLRLTLPHGHTLCSPGHKPRGERARALPGRVSRGAQGSAAGSPMDVWAGGAAELGAAHSPLATCNPGGKSAPPRGDQALCATDSLTAAAAAWAGGRTCQRHRPRAPPPFAPNPQQQRLALSPPSPSRWGAPGMQPAPSRFRRPPRRARWLLGGASFVLGVALLVLLARGNTPHGLGAAAAAAVGATSGGAAAAAAVDQRPQLEQQQAQQQDQEKPQQRQQAAESKHTGIFYVRWGRRQPSAGRREGRVGACAGRCGGGAHVAALNPHWAAPWPTLAHRRTSCKMGRW